EAPTPAAGPPCREPAGHRPAPQGTQDGGRVASAAGAARGGPAARERPFPPRAPTYPVAPAPPTEVSPSSPALRGGRLAQPALAARRRRLALRGLGDGQAVPLGLRGGRVKECLGQRLIEYCFCLCKSD